MPGIPDVRGDWGGLAGGPRVLGMHGNCGQMRSQTEATKDEEFTVRTVGIIRRKVTCLTP